MFEPQRFIDLQANSSFGDTKSWISGDNHNTMNGTDSSRSQTSLPYSNGNLDRALYNDLVEMIPLVQSLIEQKANNSFTRRGSMIYTKIPSRESLARKVSDIKGRMRKKKDQVDKNGSNNQDGDNYSIVSSEPLATEKVNEELISLREQVEDLQRKLHKKEELLKSAEISKNEINDVHMELDKLKRHTVEKDSLIKSIQLQLSDAKIKLADKQAALEKTQWEAMTSKQQLEKLQNNMDSMQGEFSTFMMFLNSLTKSNPSTNGDDYDLEPYHLDPLPYIDDDDDKEMLKMEEARQAYLVALAATKEKQDEDSFAAAASARLHLQSFLFRSENAE